MTQQQLQLLIEDKRDDIDEPEDLRAGDVAFFSDKGRVHHVVQVVGDSHCEGGRCTISLIDASHSGAPVGGREITLDRKGCWGAHFCFFKAGTPPPGPKTGETSP